MISDFDDDSSVEHGGDESRRSSISGYETEY